MIGGTNMSTVTMSLEEYNELYDRAKQLDNLLWIDPPYDGSTILDVRLDAEYVAEWAREHFAEYADKDQYILRNVYGGSVYFSCTIADLKQGEDS
jgi:hypothetical protein